MNKEDPDLFEKYGLEVAEGAVEVGKVYPVYGMITKFIKEDENEDVEVEVNFNMRVIMNFHGDLPEKLALLKERSFEPGIFITEVVSKGDEDDYGVVGRCTTVVFGRKQTENMV